MPKQKLGDDIQFIPGLKLPDDFVKAVGMLTRPYAPISRAYYDEIMEVTAQHDTDFILLPDDRLVTFGTADGGLALMPVNTEASKKLKKTRKWRHFTKGRQHD